MTEINDELVEAPPRTEADALGYADFGPLPDPPDCQNTVECAEEGWCTAGDYSALLGSIKTALKPISALFRVNVPRKVVCTSRSPTKIVKRAKTARTMAPARRR